MFSFKFKIDLNNYILFYVIFIFICFCKPFLINIVDYKNIFFFKILFGILGFQIILLFFSLILHKKSAKILSILFLLINSFALYFMNSLNIQIDENMIINLFQTNYVEAVEFVRLKLFIYVLLFGVLPSFFIIKCIDINEIKIKNKITFIVCVFLSIIPQVIYFLHNANYYNFVKKNKKSINNLLPVNYVKGVIEIIDTTIDKYKDKTIKIISDDLDVNQNFNGNNKKNLVVFVLGESARAKNFSLNGYIRETNPLLKEQNIINFSNVNACATSTFLSLPCIFSHFERTDFDVSKAEKTENILDIFQKLNFNMMWKSNNGDCKGVCNRISHDVIKNPYNNSDDKYLFEILKQEIERVNNKNNFIVLHQRGSHGPLYYQRYPKEFEQFKPVCKDSLENCSVDEIVNAYDNTILYNDYLLNDAIEFLKTKSEIFNIMFVFISDHGESLGENNKYMHGLPYAIAGEEQKQIPFFIWFSDGFIENFNISINCLNKKINTQISHDNIFHSLLGAFDIKSQYYRSDLDLFSGCKNK